jgi:hypothetical protein
MAGESTTRVQEFQTSLDNIARTFLKNKERKEKEKKKILRISRKFLKA